MESLKNLSTPGIPPAEGTLALRDASRTSSRPGAPYGPNRNDWAFAQLRTAPHIRREEALRKNTIHENLIHISLNSTKIHMSRMEFLIVQSVFDEAF